MANPPKIVGNEWLGTLISRPDEKKGSEHKLAPGTQPNPTDLAPGLRPRPHPAVPMMHSEFQGVPPPPPPPGPAPKIVLPETPKIKIPPKKAKDPETEPASPKEKLKTPDPIAMVDELKVKLVQKGLTKNFKEPKREPPLKSPTARDAMMAEIPAKIVQLKPTGNAGAVNRMKADIENTQAREDDHKKKSPAIQVKLKPVGERAKQPPLKPFPEESPKAKERGKPIAKEAVILKEQTKPNEPSRLKKPTVPSPKKVALSKVEQPSKLQNLPKDVNETKDPVAAPQCVAGAHLVALETRIAELPNPYILWPIRVLGILLVFLAFLKIEAYLWLISWEGHIWKQIYL
ncbi:hypothetical protein TWF730_010643 [Orbilia blumenaviensis]|uniref:WH2 domain-containing protein n=1 Tax=Orbilia blumenaviensis TaxID=1796055 RepID=A0AAV9UNS5_9PEZI